MIKRNYTIDVMKAIGILSVVSFHCLGELGLGKFNSFNMPLFFLLSGWTGIPEIPVVAIIKKLIIRLLYVYLLFNMIVVIGKCVFPNINSDSPLYGVPQFLIDPTLAPMQISWFLYFLFFYKAFHAVIFRIFKNTNKLHVVASLLIIVLSIKVLSFYFATKEPNIINFGFYYFSGACLFYTSKTMWRDYLPYVGLFVLAAIILVNVFGLPIVNYTLYSLIGIYGVFSISNIFIKSKTLSKVFLFIGKRTMEIYLFHYFVQIAFRGRFTDLSHPVAFISLFSVSVLGSLMLALLLEKWKSGRTILLGKF